MTDFTYLASTTTFAQITTALCYQPPSTGFWPYSRSVTKKRPCAHFCFIRKKLLFGAETKIDIAYRSEILRTFDFWCFQSDLRTLEDGRVRRTTNVTNFGDLPHFLQNSRNIS